MQLKAQSLARMSAVIMREMVENVIYHECPEIALTARKELVKRKKLVLSQRAEILRRNRMKRRFQTYVVLH